MLRTLLVLLVVLVAASPAAAADIQLPPGFERTVVWQGLGTPTVIRFAPDGQVFVATKSGIVWRFSSIEDGTPEKFADLSASVFDAWDRGLIGMTLDPRWATHPYVYVSYAHDKAVPGSLQTTWGDTCPDAIGAHDRGCAINARLSRLDASGTEHVLLEDICQQYASHSVGSLEFGPDGALYMSAGDGASYDRADYGQVDNPCGDPPSVAWTGLTAPTAQGGALRSQSYRRPAGQPATLNGAILRLNPDTGEAFSGTDPDPRRRRILAYGLRNPFRFTFDPEGREIWTGDVGWNSFEEINRVPLDRVSNFGWPCYEGPGRNETYDLQNLDSCEQLYVENTAVPPVFTYSTGRTLVDGEPCPTVSSSVSGLAFYTGEQFPAAYRGGLFFSDFNRQCIWFAPRGPGGQPDFGRLQTFASSASGPAFLTLGPDEALWYVDVFGGAVHRIAAVNQNPVARVTASPSGTEPPLRVDFDGTASFDPEGEPITYAWDLDGDNQFDDSTAAKPSYTYTERGLVNVRLKVTDAGGHSGIVTEVVTVGRVPEVSIDVDTSPWAVDEPRAFSGTAIDHTGQALPASAFTWSLILRHCWRGQPDGCHSHVIQDYVGTRADSFRAPNHEWPAHLLLTATATDQDGLSASETVRLDPREAEVAMSTTPPGLKLSLGSDTLAAPFTHTVIAKSRLTIAAERQGFEDASWDLTGWAHGGASTQQIIAPDGGTAAYAAAFSRPPRTSLAGAEVIGPETSSVGPRYGAAYAMHVYRAGTARTVRVYLDPAHTASRVQVAVYDAPQASPPTTRLATAVIDKPVPGAWNVARLSTPVPMSVGQTFWLALLNPAGSTGQMVWRHHAGAPIIGQWTAAEGMDELPAEWVTAPGHWHADGHVSAGVWAEDLVEPTPTATATPRAETPRATPTPPPADPPAAPPVWPAEPAPTPVAAWGFDEPRGTTTADASGHGHTGRLAGPARVAGRYGRGLRFDGRDDWVTVAAHPRLDLKTGMALEAWVYPTARRGLSTVALKEAGRGLAYALYTGSGRATTAAERAANLFPARKRWTHLAVTYDGTALRTYANGELVGTQAMTGRLRTGRQPLRFGGNAVWREWFAGKLDEIRLYDRALTAAQIQADMHTPIAGPTRATGGRTVKGATVKRYRGRAPHR